MCRARLLLVALVIGLSQARTVPSRSRQAVKAYAYVLPAGAEEIRDDINHSFVCANRTDGFYVDIDNDCQIFHRCQDRARFSFICAEKTVFSQMYQTCVHDGQLGFPCEDSAEFFPDGDGTSNEGQESNSDTGKLSFQSSTAAAIPSQILIAPEESPKPVAAADEEEQSAGSVIMPTSDNFVNEIDYHQLNADTFDPIEDNESENTAQEVVDQADQLASVDVNQVASENSDSTQEIEVNDEDHVIENHDNPSPVEQENAHDAVVSNEIITEDNGQQVAGITIPVNNPSVESQSLLHDNVQIIEESEPIVHDVHEAELGTTVPSFKIGAQSESVDVQPLAPTDVTINAAEPETKLINDANVQQPNLENVVAKIELNKDSSEESEQKVDEPLNVESSPNEQVQTPTNEPIAELLTPEDDSQLIPSITITPQAIDQSAANEIHPLLAATLAERLAGQPSMINLPEFIVSTVADLRKGVPSPPLRRRKTFLFKADAIST
ncbi:uncharacterized protein LOC131688056 [Topomyia yanbarensis]|uniref:uncharacterized protein LOC131688056 n=1 Tax=Topomyia yanbarensis TaxID=2498891 RepID=UPI00273AAD1B|nr:uncharacterized protein LOC131688056 [Topomyia yanbarensis]